MSVYWPQLKRFTARGYLVETFETDFIKRGYAWLRGLFVCNYEYVDRDVSIRFGYCDEDASRYWKHFCCYNFNPGKFLNVQIDIIYIKNGRNVDGRTIFYRELTGPTTINIPLMGYDRMKIEWGFQATVVCRLSREKINNILKIDSKAADINPARLLLFRTEDHRMKFVNAYNIAEYADFDSIDPIFAVAIGEGPEEHIDTEYIWVKKRKLEYTIIYGEIILQIFRRNWGVALFDRVYPTRCSGHISPLYNLQLRTDVTYIKRKEELGTPEDVEGVWLYTQRKRVCIDDYCIGMAPQRVEVQHYPWLLYY